MTNPNVRKLGKVTSVHGITHDIGTDHDAVTIDGWALDAAGRAEFMRWYTAAEAEAMAWAEANAGETGGPREDGGQ